MRVGSGLGSTEGNAVGCSEGAGVMVGAMVTVGQKVVVGRIVGMGTSPQQRT